MFPDPSKPYIIHFDSSETGTGAVLQQRDNAGLLRPLEFFSKKWNPAEYNYSTPDKELFGLVLALQHWNSILYDAKHVEVFTDHKSLRDFSKTLMLKPRHARWALILEDFRDKMTISWIPGKSNVVADAASRDPQFTLNEEETRKRLETVMLPESIFAHNLLADGYGDSLLTTDPGESLIPPQGSRKFKTIQQQNFQKTHQPTSSPTETLLPTTESNRQPPQIKNITRTDSLRPSLWAPPGTDSDADNKANAGSPAACLPSTPLPPVALSSTHSSTSMAERWSRLGSVATQDTSSTHNPRVTGCPLWAPGLKPSEKRVVITPAVLPSYSDHSDTP